MSAWDHRPGIARALKRMIDLIGALVGLVILSPSLLLIALFIIVDDGWPPLFIQERIGYRGKSFRLVKFRTMVRNAEKIGAGLYFEKDDPRFTRSGPFLRRFSLDELPQLINVVLGHESLVGPRATVPQVVDQFTAEQQRRHTVPPGITGWAQVNGRNELTWSERVMLDLWYIDNWSLWLDVKILFRTIAVALAGDGVRMDQQAAEVDDLQAGK